MPGITGDNLLVLLERRMDNVVFRLGFADSRSQARQLVLHGHIMLNGKKSDIPSAFVKEGDTISWREGSKKTEYYKVVAENIEAKNIVNWLSLDRQNMTGQVVTLPTRTRLTPSLTVKPSSSTTRGSDQRRWVNGRTSSPKN